MNFLVLGNPSAGYQTRIPIRQGETVTLGLQFIDSDGIELDITGYTINAEIAFPTPLLLSTTNGGIIINDSITGKIQMNIASSITAEIVPGSYPFDLFLISPNGAETPWLCGSFIVIQSITPVP